MQMSYKFDISRSMEINAARNSLLALAHETRLDVFQRLMRSDAKGISAGALADAIGVLPNTLSAHLAQLKRAELISVTRKGRSLHYSANEDGIRALLHFLLQDCCDGRPELCAPFFDQLHSGQQTEKLRHSYDL